MTTPADFRIEHRDRETVVQLLGDWTSLGLGDAPLRLERALPGGGPVRIDTSQLGRVDTAGTYAALRILDAESRTRFDDGGREDLQRLVDLVRDSLDTHPPGRDRAAPLRAAFEAIGFGVVQAGREFWRGQEFTGRMVAAVGRVARHPRRLRITPLVSAMERAGFGAIPIVMILNFFVGAVFALVCSTMLQMFSANAYVVELVGIGVLREFGVLFAAIIFAGRSASSFAAQLGSMRMNQEVDAMRVMGIDEYEALVVPRLVAALLALPLLAFVGNLGGLAGGMLVAWILMGITPEFFLERMVDMVGTRHFWLGMAKAPFFAIVIAGTGCRQGFEVKGDVESLGARVTTAVVQSIFLIIMFDAIFAVLYWQLEL